MTRQIALVGIGKIAQDQHVPALEASQDWALVATCSLHGSVPGVPAFSDLGAMLAAHPGIDTVSICVPPVPRYPLARAALAAGRNVMLEKPPGASVSECHALADLAEAQGRTLFASWHSREADRVAAAKAWLADKRLVSLAVTWREDVRRWHPGQDWIWQPGGLGVFDPGINALSIVTEILPDPIHLTGAELQFPANRDTPIAATLRFAQHTADAVEMAFDWRQDGDQIWTIVAETDGGTMMLSEGGARLTIDGVSQGTGSDNPLGGEYPALYARMAALVAAGKSDVDLAPLRHVADAFMLGRRTDVAAFHW